VINHVESELNRLPEPEPPATLVGTVMARVSRLADERTPASVASPAWKRRSRDGRVGSWNDLPAWVAALAGLAIVFVSWINGGLEPNSLLDLISLQAGSPNVVGMPPNGLAVLGLALGLLLYLAGLFAPVRKRQ
jgi:hypothetical protein